VQGAHRHSLLVQATLDRSPGLNGVRSRHDLDGHAAGHGPEPAAGGQRHVVVRLVHGFATAIYGPVVSALVADLFPRRRAECMGWYWSARTASYFLGPLIGGFILLYADARSAWIAVGVLGLVTFLPALVLARREPVAVNAERAPARWFVVEQLRRAFTDPLLRLGLVQTVLYLGLRANSTFLLIYGLSIGVNPAQVGLLLSTQVGATLLVQPAAGRLADRLGPRPVIVAGLLLLAAGLPLMVMVDHFLALATLGVALGAGEGLVTPAINAAVTEPVKGRRYGSLPGMLDSMDNVGKALGPIVAGLLISLLSFVGAFSAIAALVAASAASIWTAGVPARAPAVSHPGTP
jgi:MFS transporter, DHA1 family, multidrug resistance protein